MGIVTAASLRLPASVGRRDVNVPDTARNAAFDAAYDHDTLFYDAIALPRGAALVGPSLLNLRALVEGAQMSLDGKPARIRRITSRRRSDEIYLRGPGTAQNLSIRIGTFQTDLPLTQPDTAAFAGLNCSVIFNKNNDPEGIADFARFHQHHHGLQGLVVVDNGSDAYPLDDIAAALDPVGLTQWRVLSIPTSWGALAEGGHVNDALFFQTAGLNIARLRFLSRARAVLVCDLDELVLPHADGHSVFDLARRRFWGFTPVRGQNCYPGPDAQGRLRHRDHTHRPTQARPPSTKYCINPRGLLRGVGWEVHKPDFISVDKAMDDRGMRFAHCLGISNGWKNPGRAHGHTDIALDADLAAAMTAAFGTATTLSPPPPLD